MFMTHFCCTLSAEFGGSVFGSKCLCQIAEVSKHLPINNWHIHKADESQCNNKALRNIAFLLRHYCSKFGICKIKVGIINVFTTVLLTKRDYNDVLTTRGLTIYLQLLKMSSALGTKHFAICFFFFFFLKGK